MDKRKIYQLTRQSGFLWKSAGLLAAALVAVGTGISFLNTDRLDLFQEILSAPRYAEEPELNLSRFSSGGIDERLIAEALAESLQHGAPFHERLLEISYLLYYLEPEGPVTLPPLGNLSSNELAIADGLIACYSGSRKASGFQALGKLAEGEAPPDANYALALANQDRNETRLAVDALGREINLHNSDHARERIVEIYLGLEKFEILNALSQEPEYAAFFTPGILQKIALAQLDWPMILKTLLPASYENIQPGMVFLALLSGLVWALVLLRFNGSFSSVWKVILPALVLGAFSAHATLLAVFWQDYQLGFGFSGGMYQQLLYCLSIGLREEFLKLLFFAPLIPLLRQKSDLQLLTAAALVGLGFAIEENISYFDASAGLSAVARFATANFLHIALTAMCGLTLARAVYHRGEDIQHAASTFILAVAVHGFYDAFLMVPDLANFSWLTYTVFVLMGYQYFGWLRHLREAWQDPFSITAVFTYGIILVTGFSYILYAWQAGPGPALQAVVGEAIGTAVILVLFYREIPETIEQP